MPVIPIDQVINTDTTPQSNTPVSSGNVTPLDQITDPFASLISQQRAGEGSSRGIVEDVAKSIGSGFIKGGETALRLEQNTANLVGKGIQALSGKPVEVAQWYGDLANKLEETRQSYYGNSKSVLGKVTEGVAQLPALIGMVGAGGETGVLTKGTEALGGLSANGLSAIATKFPSLESALAPVIGAIGKGALSGPTAGFATMGALEAQPQGAGEMLKQGMIGGIQGALLGRASKMPILSGSIVAGTAMTAPTALSPNATKQDIAAQFVMGAGFNALGQSDLKTLHQRALEDVSKLPQDVKGFVGHAVDIHFAEENLQSINSEIKQTISEQKADETRIKLAVIDNNEQIKAEQEKQSEQFGTQKTALEIQKQQAQDAELNKILEEHNKLNKNAEQLGNALDNTSANIADKIKSGEIDKIVGQLEDSYDKGVTTIGSTIEKTKPFTLTEEKDFWTKCKADAEAQYVDPNDPIMKKIDLRLKQIESNTGVDASRNVMGTKYKFSEILARQGEAKARQYFPEEEYPQLYSEKGNSIPFGELKTRIGSIKKGAPSAAGGIINNNFKNLVEGKLKGTQNEGAFLTLQGNYEAVKSYVDSVKTTFGEGLGEASIRGAQKFLKDSTGISPDVANRRILSFLEKGEGGRGMIQGVGDVSSTLKDMNLKLSQLETEMERLKDPSYRIAQSAQKYVTELSDLANTNDLSIKTLALKQKMFKEQMKLEASRIGAEYETKLKELGGDKNYFSKLKTEKSGVLSSISAVLYGLVPFNAKLFRLLRATTMASRRYI